MKAKKKLDEPDDFDERGKLSPQGEELLRRALTQVALEEIEAIEKATEGIEPTPFSRRFKIQTNRFYREQVGEDYIPYPEVDNAFERIRSKILVKFH